MIGSEIAARTAESSAVTPERIGRTLRHAMSVAGWNQTDLVDVSGASRSIVSRWYRGDVGHGTIAFARVLAALGLLPDAPEDAPLAPQRYRERRSSPTCSIEGCGRKRIARGHCSTHYYRWQKHGDPQADIPVREKAR